MRDYIIVRMGLGVRDGMSDHRPRWPPNNVQPHGNVLLIFESGLRSVADILGKINNRKALKQHQSKLKLCVVLIKILLLPNDNRNYKSLDPLS